MNLEKPVLSPQVAEGVNPPQSSLTCSRRQQKLAVKRARLYESRKLARQARRVRQKFTRSLEKSAQASPQGATHTSTLQSQSSTDATNNSAIPQLSAAFHTVQTKDDAPKNAELSVQSSSAPGPATGAATDLIASIPAVLGQLRPRPLRAALRANTIARSASGIRVAIDLSLDSYMSDREIAKLGNQLGQIYAFNRRLSAPLQLYFTGVRGGSQIGQRYERMPEMRAWDVHWHADDYFELFSTRTSTSSSSPDASNHKQSDSCSNTADCAAAAPASTSTSTSASTFTCKLCANSSSPTAQTPTAPGSIVYLTGDSDNVLTSIEPNAFFVFGGLVDHNRHRGLTHRLATERGILRIAHYSTVCYTVVYILVYNCVVF